MKQILISLLTVFMLFTQKSSAQCNFTLTQNPMVGNQNIQVGTTVRVASWRLAPDSCGATTSSFSFLKDLSSTSADSNYTNVKFYADSVFQFNVTLLSGVTTTVNYQNTITSFDTVVYELRAALDSLAPLGQTISCDMNITLTDSNNIIQILPPASGQTMTTSGCILSIEKNPTVPDQTITPGTQKLIGSFNLDALGGCSFITTYAVLNNTDTFQNASIKNIRLKKGGVQLGSTLPVMGVNSVILFTDNITGSTVYDIYADVDTTAADSSNIILDFNLIASSPTAGYMIWVDSIGQTITINNPTTPGGIGGPCTMAVTEHPTSQWLYRGQNVCLTAFKVTPANCSLTLNSLQLEIFGTALCSDMTNLEVRKNNTTVVGTQGVMSFNQTIPLSGTISANQTDTFFIWGDLHPNALTDSRTFEPKITLSVTDSLGNPKTVVLTMATKWVKDAPTQVADVDRKSITFYPNPATDYVTITGYDGTVRITDLMGREMIQGEAVSEKTTIDVSNLPKGIYFLQLEKAKPFQLRIN